MAVDRPVARVRCDQWCRRTGQQLVEDRVRGVRDVQQQTQACSTLPQVVALDAEVVPLGQGGGRVGEVVVGEMHQADHAQALPVVGTEQTGIGNEQIDIRGVHCSWTENHLNERKVEVGWLYSRYYCLGAAWWRRALWFIFLSWFNMARFLIGPDVWLILEFNEWPFFNFGAG